MQDRLTRLMSGPAVAALAGGVLAAGAWREGWGAAAQAHLTSAQGLADDRLAIGPHPLLEWAGRWAMRMLPGSDVGALEALNAAALVALAAMVWWMGRALGGRLAGLLAAMMLVLHPDITAAMSGPGPTLPIAALMVAHVALLSSTRLGWRRWPLVGLVGAALAGSMVHGAAWWLATLLVWLLARPALPDGEPDTTLKLPLGMVGAAVMAALAPLLHPGMRALGLRKGWWAALQAALEPAAEAARFGGGWFGHSARLPAWAGPVRALVDWPLACTAGVIVGLWALRSARSTRAAWLTGVTLVAGLLLPWISGSWLMGRAEIAGLVAPWAAILWGVGAAWCARRAHAALAALHTQRAAPVVAVMVVLIACGLGAELALRSPWDQGSPLARLAGCWPLRAGHVPAALAREAPAGKPVFVLSAQPQVFGAAGEATRFVATPQQAEVIIMPGWQRSGPAPQGWQATPLGPSGAPAWWVLVR
jgi:hypothetical protein